jgi:hypothetical protein
VLLLLLMMMMMMLLMMLLLLSLFFDCVFCIYITLLCVSTCIGASLELLCSHPLRVKPSDVTEKWQLCISVGIGS